MATETLEQRVLKLEDTIQKVQDQLAQQPATETQQPATKKRGWRWFVGIYADSPDFEEVVKTGQEWRCADRPQDNQDAEKAG